jgi:hypothetical protein
MESKEQQKQLITEIMDLDAKDGLYDTVNDTVNELDKLAHQYNPVMKLDAEFIRAGFKAGYNKAKEIEKKQSQPEISDEEILEAAAKHFNKEELVEGVCIKYVLQCAFIDGTKWYREQLKNK